MPTAGPPTRSSALIRDRGGEAVASYDDVADFDGARAMVHQAIDTFGKLDVLVNNAGILRDRMIFSMTEEDFDSVIRVHLKGTWAPSHHAAVYWREQSKAGNQPRGVDHQHVVGRRTPGQRGADELRVGQGRHRGDDDHLEPRARAATACAPTSCVPAA